MQNMQKIQNRGSLVLRSSDRTLIAQTAAQCGADGIELMTYSQALTLIMERKNVDTTDAALIELLLIGGLRISEALSITIFNITGDGRIKIAGLKGSNTRIVSPMLYVSYFLYCKKVKRDPFEGRSRFYYYRLFKKLGLVKYFGEYRRSAVTHSIRHQVIADLYKNGATMQEIQQFIGHKSIKSTEHYAVKK
jgi:site-specific recombinase XerD